VEKFLLQPVLKTMLMALV